MRIHPDIVAGLPTHMIDPTVRYPYALPTLLARWYVYLPAEGHSIMAVPQGHYQPDTAADNLVAVPVRTALAASYSTAVTGHLVMQLPMEDGRVQINDDDREYQP